MKKDIKHISSGLDAQVTQVGFEFIPGREGDIELSRLLGMEAGTFGGQSLQDRGPGEWLPTPEYCSDLAFLTAELKKRGVYPMVVPSVDLPAKKASKEPVVFKQQYVALFTHGGEPLITEARDSVAHAHATVLWWVLDSKSRLT